MLSITLEPDELVRVTGGKTAPRRQLTELHLQGFWRARLGVDGKVVLERAHYDAVCAGALPPGAAKRDTPDRPKVQPIRSSA